MTIFLIRTMLAAVLAAAAVTAWSQEIPPAFQGEVDFNADVAPVLIEKCIECHDANKQKSDLRMDTRDFLLKGGIEGPALVVGDSANSLMVQLMAGTHPDFERMPPKADPLTDEQLGKIRTWIDKGAQWPEGVVLAAAGAPAPAPEATAGDHPQLAKAEGLPEDWRVEATNQQGPLASWALLTELKGPNDGPVFGVSNIPQPRSGTFNLLWTPARQLKNGMIEVAVKSIGGEEDRGGGIAWRIKDKKNYYIARYNPVEKNFRVYKVVEGKRDQIGTADVESEQEWDTIRVEHTDSQIVASLNGQPLITVTDDALPEAGGVGFWTKADAISGFSGSKIEPK